MAVGNIIGQVRKKTTDGLINGIIEQYKVAAGENVSVGDFISFISSLSGGSTSALDSESYSSDKISATALSPSKVFIAYGRKKSASSESYQLYGLVCTINENKIILGTKKQILSSSYSGHRISTVALDENRVFIAHTYGSSYYLYGIVCKIDNTTITTIGTDTKIYYATSTVDKIVSTSLSTNKIFVISAQSGGSSQMSVCEIDDITINVKAKGPLNYVLPSLTSLSVDSLSENKVIITYDGDDYGYTNSLIGYICTINKNELTLGSRCTIESTDYSGTYARVIALTENKAVIFHSFSAGYFKNAMICTIDGTNIKKEKDYALIDSNVGSFSVVKSLNNNFNIVYTKQDSTKNYVLYAMRCLIQEDNTLAIKYNLKLNSVGSVATSIVSLSENKPFITYYLADDSNPNGAVYTVGKLVKNLAYLDSINGVARTSGTEGQAIEVYVPNTNETI